MLEHDVLVIGAGLAGMRAAIAARAGGANTATVDKITFSDGTKKASDSETPTAAMHRVRP